MPTARINGFDTYYETQGTGFPVVFIHGGFGGLGTGAGGGSGPAWKDRFAEHYQVIWYDRRASGRSSYPEEGFSMENLARDALELVRYLGHEKAHVWGSSAGGQIALAYGLEFPEASAGIVVADSAPWLTPDAEVRSKLRDRVRVLTEEGAEAAYEARRREGTVGLNVYVARPQESAEEVQSRGQRADSVRQTLVQFSREERVAKYAGELRNYSAYCDWDCTPRLKDMQPPVLVIYGEADSTFPSQGNRAIERLVPRVQAKAYPGAEHGVVGRFPDALDLIEDFLRRHTLH